MKKIIAITITIILTMPQHGLCLRPAATANFDPAVEVLIAENTKKGAEEAAAQLRLIKSQRERMKSHPYIEKKPDIKIRNFLRGRLFPERWIVHELVKPTLRPGLPFPDIGRITDVFLKLDKEKRIRLRQLLLKQNVIAAFLDSITNEETIQSSPYSAKLFIEIAGVNIAYTALINSLLRRGMPVSLMLTESIACAEEAIAIFADRKGARDVVINLGLRLAEEGILPCSTINYGVRLAARASGGRLEYFKNNAEELMALALQLDGINPYRTLVEADRILDFTINPDEFKSLLSIAKDKVSLSKKLKDVSSLNILTSWINSPDDLYAAERLLVLEKKGIDKLTRVITTKEIVTRRVETGPYSHEWVPGNAINPRMISSYTSMYCPSGTTSSSPVEGTWETWEFEELLEHDHVYAVSIIKSIDNLLAPKGFDIDILLRHLRMMDEEAWLQRSSSLLYGDLKEQIQNLIKESCAGGSIVNRNPAWLAISSSA